MIRLYKAGDEEQINLLYQAVFGKTRSLEEWKWKFEILSFGQPIIIVAEMDGKIVGHAACLKISGAFQKEITLLGERVDIMVHPDYRNQGIYKQIVQRLIIECEKQDVKILYGFPAPKAKDVFMKVAGGLDLGNVPRFIAVKKPAGLLASKVAVLRLIQKPADKLYGFAAERKSPYRLREALPADLPEIDSLYEKYAKEYALHAVRDADYIKRRFLLHPKKNYEVCLIENKQGISGFAVLLTESKANGMTVTTIVDIWGKNEAKTLALMLRAVRNYSQCDLMNCWAVKDSERFSALKKAGFFHVNSPLPFVIKTFDSGLQTSQMSNWHLSQSDVDSY